MEVANQSCQTSVIRSISGWLVRTMRSSHHRWSWPQASSGASGSPSSVGAGPVSVACPYGPGERLHRPLQPHRRKCLRLPRRRAQSPPATAAARPEPGRRGRTTWRSVRRSAACPRAGGPGRIGGRNGGAAGAPTGAAAWAPRAAAWACGMWACASCAARGRISCERLAFDPPPLLGRRAAGGLALGPALLGSGGLHPLVFDRREPPPLGRARPRWTLPLLHAQRRVHAGVAMPIERAPQLVVAGAAGRRPPPPRHPAPARRRRPAGIGGSLGRDHEVMAVLAVVLELDGDVSRWRAPDETA